MGLFGGTKETTETTKSSSTNWQDTSIAGIGSQEQGARDLMARLAGGAGGQIGDLSGLASGQMPSLPPQMQALLQQMMQEQVGRETGAAQRAFQDARLSARDQAVARGQSGSSMDAMYQAIAGREHEANIGDIQSRASQFLSQQQLALPFQIAQQQLATNDMLYRMATQNAQGLGMQSLQERMAQTSTRGGSTTNQTTKRVEPTGGLMGGLMSLGSSLAGMGAFGPIGSLFSGFMGSGGSGSAGSPNMYSSPIGPTIGGAPQGTLNNRGPGMYGPAF